MRLYTFRPFHSVTHFWYAPTTHLSQRWNTDLNALRTHFIRITIEGSLSNLRRSTHFIRASYASAYHLRRRANALAWVASSGVSSAFKSVFEHKLVRIEDVFQWVWKVRIRIIIRPYEKVWFPLTIGCTKSLDAVISPLCLPAALVWLN